MSARGPAHDGNGRRTSRTRRAGSAAAGAAGLTGALVCGSAMVLAGLGVGTSTAAVGMAGMADMDRASTAPHGLLSLLVRVGPGLLIASAVLMAVAFALRRPGAAAPRPGPARRGGAVRRDVRPAQPHRHGRKHRGRLCRMGSPLPVGAQRRHRAQALASVPPRSKGEGGPRWPPPWRWRLSGPAHACRRAPSALWPARSAPTK